jgi:hypothetical protein
MPYNRTMAELPPFTSVPDLFLNTPAQRSGRNGSGDKEAEK